MMLTQKEKTISVSIKNLLEKECKKQENTAIDNRKLPK